MLDFQYSYTFYRLPKRIMNRNLLKVVQPFESAIAEKPTIFYSRVMGFYGIIKWIIPQVPCDVLFSQGHILTTNTQCVPNLKTSITAYDWPPFIKQCLFGANVGLPGLRAVDFSKVSHCRHIWLWDELWVTVRQYPLVNKHSYWKWPFIVDLPIKNGDFP